MSWRLGNYASIALESLGYRYVAAASNITGRGVIPESVGVEPGLESNAELILERLPADIRASEQSRTSEVRPYEHRMLPMAI